MIINLSFDTDESSPKPLNLARFRAFFVYKILHIFIKIILTSYK